MRRPKPTRIEAPFTNRFGEVINVGDRVVASGKSSGSASFYRGLYMGYVEYTPRYWGGRDKTPIKKVQIRNLETGYVHTLINNRVALGK